MRISVIGCGYLGSVHSACMASLGHEVVALDVNADRVASLAQGRPPFHEPGFAELLTEALATGRLTFTTDPAAIAGSRLHFIAVGTPQLPGRIGADLQFLWAAVDNLIEVLGTQDASSPTVIVGKSTVPVGTADAIDERLRAAQVDAIVAWNPEFLREGFALADTLHPDRIVYGLPEDEHQGEQARQALDECYAALLEEGIPRLLANRPTAELVKVAANSFLATKISFINAMAELCEASGADVTKLAAAIGYDDRIGKKFLRAGIGFGGGCLPKDIRAFMARAGELGVDQALTFLREVDAINLRRRERAVEMALAAVQGRFVGRRVAILGAAFKPDSDDMRDSPALDIASKIWSMGADVAIVDPAAGPVLARERPNLNVVETVEQAVTGADLVMLLTEWPEFIALDPERLKPLVRQATIIDGRNVLDPQRWAEAGWAYHGMGRHTSMWN